MRAERLFRGVLYIIPGLATLIACSDGESSRESTVRIHPAAVSARDNVQPTTSQYRSILGIHPPVGLPRPNSNGGSVILPSRKSKCRELVKMGHEPGLRRDTSTSPSEGLQAKCEKLFPPAPAAPNRRRLVVQLDVRVGLQRETDVGVAGQCLSHLGRDPGSLQAGDEKVSAAVEVGAQAVVVLVGEEVGLSPMFTLPLGLGLVNPLVKSLQRARHGFCHVLFTHLGGGSTEDGTYRRPIANAAKVNAKPPNVHTKNSNTIGT